MLSFNSLFMGSRKILFTTLFVSLGACSESSIESTHVVDSRYRGDGISYFLAKGLVSLTVSFNQTDGLKIEPDPVEYIPDPRKQYLVRLKESVFADDDFSIQTDSKGLLAAVNTTNHDKSVNITKKLLSLVSEIAKLGIGAPEGVSRKGTDQIKKRKPFKVKLLFDPFDSKDLWRAKKILKKHGIALGINFLSGLRIKPAADLEFRNESVSPQDCQSSVCFRPLIPVKIRLTDQYKGIGGTQTHAQYLGMLPNQLVTVGFNVTRGPCIKKLTELTFTYGTLTKVHLNKPSEVESCLDIPLEVVKKIVSLPGELLTFRVAGLEGQKSLFAAQTSLLDAQTKLLLAQTNAQANKK